MNTIRIKVNNKFQILFLNEIYEQYKNTGKIIIDGYELSSHQIKRVIDQKYPKNKLNTNETSNKIETLTPRNKLSINDVPNTNETLNQIETLTPRNKLNTEEALSTDELNEIDYENMNLDVYDESDFEPLKRDTCNIDNFSNKYDNSLKINPFYVVNTINQLLHNHNYFFNQQYIKTNNFIINNFTSMPTNPNLIQTNSYLKPTMNTPNQNNTNFNMFLKQEYRSNSYQPHLFI